MPVWLFLIVLTYHGFGHTPKMFYSSIFFLNMNQKLKIQRKENNLNSRTI